MLWFFVAVVFFLCRVFYVLGISFPTAYVERGKVIFEYNKKPVLIRKKAQNKIGQAILYALGGFIILNIISYCFLSAQWVETAEYHLVDDWVPTKHVSSYVWYIDKDNCYFVHYKNSGATIEQIFYLLSQDSAIYEDNQNKVVFFHREMQPGAEWFTFMQPVRDSWTAVHVPIGTMKQIEN